MIEASRKHRRALVAAVAVLGASTTHAAARADEPVAVRISYEGRRECPDAEAFSREVLVRAPRARIAPASERARVLVVRVRAAGGALDGALVVHEPGGTSTERAVHAASCDELVTALAVIAAVVIDPLTARTGAVEAPAASADPSPAADDAAIEVAPPPSAAVAPPRSPPAAEAPPEVREVPAASRGWRLSAGVGGGLVAGSAPTVLLSVPAFVEVSDEGRRLLSPSLRVWFVRTSTSANSEGGAFVRTGGAADVCPLALRAHALRAEPCARAEVAALHASGRGVEPARSDVRPWLAFGAVARVRVEVAPPIFVELEAALLVAAVRDRFYIEPFAVVYRPPAVGGTTAFAVGAAF